jgi:hypothetical protein
MRPSDGGVREATPTPIPTNARDAATTMARALKGFFSDFITPSYLPKLGKTSALA